MSAPPGATAVLERADLLVDLERWADARETLAPYVAAHPEDPAALVLLAQCALGEREIGAAWHLAEQVLVSRPDDDQAHKVAAIAAAGLLRVDEAREHAQQAIRLQPWNWTGYVVRAEVDLVTGRVDDATVTAAQTATTYGPREPLTHLVLGQVHNARTEPDDARAALEQVLRLDPDNAQAHRELGEAATTQLSLHDAVRTYRRAAALRPGDPRVARDLAGVVRRFFTTFSIALLAAAGIGMLLRNTDHVRLFYTAFVSVLLLRTGRKFRRVLAEGGKEQRRAIRHSTPGIIVRTTGLLLALLVFWAAAVVLPEGRMAFYLTSMALVIGSGVLSVLVRSVRAAWSKRSSGVV